MTDSRWAGAGRAPLLLLLTALIYLAAIYGLTPGNALFFHPIHHDDYAALAAEPVLHATRPLYYLFVGLLAGGGMTAYYAAMHLLTVVLNAQVLLLLTQRFALQRPLLPVLATLMLTFAHPVMVEVGRYNLLTNLLAGTLSLAAAAQYRAYLQGGGRLRLVAGTAALTLGLLAKEDFVLPVLVLSGAALLTEPRRKQAWWPLVLGLTAAVLTIGAARLLTGSTFVSGSSDPTAPYFINPDPRSVLSTLMRYLSYTGATALQNWWWLGLIAFSVAVRRRLVQPWILLAGLSLTLPYALLPNHIYSYYAVNWSCWLSGYAVFAAADALETLTSARLQRMGRLVLAACAALLLIWAGPQRTVTAQRYVEESRRQARITTALASYRDELRAWPVVGLRGLPLFNPWFYNDAVWPARQGYTNHWVLEVDPTAWYFQFYEPWIAAELPDARVRYISSAERDAYAELAWLEFDPDGNARLTLPGGDR